MDARDDKPPQAPPIRRTFSLEPVQIIGIPCCWPCRCWRCSACSGSAAARSRWCNPGMVARVSYPERFRYKTTHPLEITVRNTGLAPLSRVIISVDRTYLSAFSDVEFTSTATAVAGGGYVIELGDISPGGESNAIGSVQAEAYGRHRGTVRIVSDTGTPLEPAVETIVLP